MVAGLLSLAACRQVPGGPTVPTTPATVPPTTASPGVVPTGTRYDIASGPLTDIWVDPVSGDDGRDGSSRVQAVRTITAAWQRIPLGTATNGYRIALTAGTYPADAMPNYWDERSGTRTAPIVIESVDGIGAAVTSNMNVFGVDYLYVIGLRITSPYDLFHCEQCDHLLLRHLTIEGVGAIDRGEGPQEGVKINQSTNVYIEDSDISGATDNALDMVAVQYGHILGNRIHRAIDWCVYTKGGSAYFAIEGNEIYDCGTGGYTAGQGTGFQFMTEPWIAYEAYAIRFVNNVIHHIEGAAFGAAGAYDTLFAYNTAFDVGARSQLVDVVLGRRGCDGAPDDIGAVARCRSLLDNQGWGTTGEELEIIPARSVWIFDNVFLNPAGHQSGSQHFQIHQCQTVDTAATGVPSPTCVDDDLRIEGNVIWNGGTDMPLGADGALADRVLAANTLNRIEPRLVDPDRGDYRPAADSPLRDTQAIAIPTFTWNPAGPPVPVGAPSTTVTVNRAGEPRSPLGWPGAY
jgi:hypothetical protein